MKFATFELFSGVCSRHGVPEERTKEVYDRLVAHYTAADRYYHNLAHIDHMLGLLDGINQPDDELILAIWFHDAIYDAKKNHNERLSADYFLQQFEGYFWTDFSREVERLIIATDPRRPRRGTGREDLIIDLDLSILGSDPDCYQAYREGVRKEYAFVPEDRFQEGRTQILQSFLEGPIFATRRFQYLEEPARRNLSNEIASYEQA